MVKLDVFLYQLILSISHYAHRCVCTNCVTAVLVALEPLNSGTLTHTLSFSAYLGKTIKLINVYRCALQQFFNFFLHIFAFTFLTQQ